MAILSIMEWRYFKTTGMHMGSKEAQHMQLKDNQNEDGMSFQSDIALPERSFDRTRGTQY